MSHSCASTIYFNSQASYEARQSAILPPNAWLSFQFTGLIRGPTSSILRPKMSHTLFQFTGLIRGPTRVRRYVLGYDLISIHRPHTRPDETMNRIRNRMAISIHRPHTRPDQPSKPGRLFLCNFNSQASYEARPPACGRPPRRIRFQFTGLIRGPTK